MGLLILAVVVGVLFKVGALEGGGNEGVVHLGGLKDRLG